MKKINHYEMAVFFIICLLIGGCKTDDVSAGKMKFERLFCWGTPNNEKNAKRYASAGVTDIIVSSKKQYDLALKYGMNPYWKVFTPTGPHKQVMAPEEEKNHAYINGKDLDKKLSRSERGKILRQRRIEKQHRFGGEMVVENDTLHADMQCFISDEGLVLARKKLDQILAAAPKGSKGMFLDGIGYVNHKGCYCKQCLLKYEKYLSDRKLADTPENQTAFYREKLVQYYNGIIDYIKSKRPDYKIGAHLWPDFKEDPLFGNRIKVDYCGQTVSWYFKWNEEKIRKYTDFVLNHARDYYSFAEGIPFIGVSQYKTGALGYKTPEDVERELKIIFEAGGRTVMVCNGNAILQDGYYEVFRKYCGKE